MNKDDTISFNYEDVEITVEEDDVHFYVESDCCCPGSRRITREQAQELVEFLQRKLQ